MNEHDVKLIERSVRIIYDVMISNCPNEQLKKSLLKGMMDDIAANLTPRCKAHNSMIKDGWVFLAGYGLYARKGKDAPECVNICLGGLPDGYDTQLVTYKLDMRVFHTGRNSMLSTINKLLGTKYGVGKLALKGG